MAASLSSVALLPRERTAAMIWLRFAFVNTSRISGGTGPSPGSLADSYHSLGEDASKTGHAQ